MNIVDASKMLMELAKLEETLEEGCKDCEQCASTKAVKNELINIMSWILREQSVRIVELNKKAIKQHVSSLGEEATNDPEIIKLMQRFEEIIKSPGAKSIERLESDKEESKKLDSPPSASPTTTKKSDLN